MARTNIWQNKIKIHISAYYPRTQKKTTTRTMGGCAIRTYYRATSGRTCRGAGCAGTRRG